jgi:hypothetical protein
MVDFDTNENISYDDFLVEFERMQTFILMRAIQNSFQECDLDKNGALNKDEFAKLLIKHTGSEDQARRQVDILFRQCDVDGNGELSLEEVATWYFTSEVGIKAKQDRLRKLKENDDLEHQMKMLQLSGENAQLAMEESDAEAKRKQRALLAERKRLRRLQKEKRLNEQYAATALELTDMSSSMMGMTGIPVADGMMPMMPANSSGAPALPQF